MKAPRDDHSQGSKNAPGGGMRGVPLAKDSKKQRIWCFGGSV